MRPTLSLAVFAVPAVSAVLASLSFVVVACGDEAAGPPAAPPVAIEGAVAIDIVYSHDAPPIVAFAAEDLADVFAARTGAERRPPNAAGSAPVAVELVIDASASELGDEGFRLEATMHERPTLEVRARTERGAAYGLWSLAWDVGARWIHPEDTVVPLAPEQRLPWPGEPVTSVPTFARRGFHEHTQHPIPASDIFLRADFPGGREAVSHELRWLARNRQNLLTVHFLDTVDLATWVPYMAGIVAEAHDLGIELGVVLGFADQQQHAFRLVRADAVDGAGVAIPAETQIADGLDRVLASGIDHVVFQFGTSEFTAPDPAVTLAWLDAAVAHIVSHYPSVTPHAWIHITCGLETADGADFFHLPLGADAALGAWVHTTMFYTLSSPAPVYDCEDFSHQLDFIAAADGAREQTFFPETAWWLGFDDNVPLLLPITGRARAADIATVRQHEVSGHVTFTSGREHLYWLYDLYVARASWDADLGWDAFLDAVAPVWGEHADVAAQVLKDIGARQEDELFRQNPEIIFYLAGELPQDEVGAAAGVLARRPKIALKTVRDYDDAAFAAWKTKDFDMLERMRAGYADIVARLPAASDRLYREVVRAATTHLARIEHALAIYGGVIAVRAGDRAAAEAKLADARAISARVKAEMTSAEADYRDPVEWLARPKPESLTVYPFGYLYETSSAYFWTRRDDQLAALVTSTFDGEVEAWPAPAPTAVFAAEPDTTVLTTPDDDVARSVLGGFVPRLLIGVQSIDSEAGIATLVLAPDRNGNDLPDIEPLTLTAALQADASGFNASLATWVLPVYDTADQKIGDLVLRDATVVGELARTRDTASALPSMSIAGEVLSEELIAMVQSVVGIDREGIETLMKDVWNLDAAAPLPTRLPFALALSPVAPTAER